MTVQDLIIQQVMPKLKGQQVTISALTAVREAITAVGQELVRRASTVVQEASTLAFTAGLGSKALPDGFYGLAAHPCIDGNELTEIQTRELYSLADSGSPEKYRVVGNTIYLYPAPDAAVTLQLVCNIIPSGITMTDELPWLGLFDLLIADTASRLAIAGAVLRVDPAFVSMVGEGVTAVLVPRTRVLPRTRPIKFF